MAAPCSPIVPLIIILSPTLMLLIPNGLFLDITPMPVVFINSLSPFPFSTTFVSPHTILILAFIASWLIVFIISSSSFIASPSSIISESDKYKGIAPTTDRSLTVPQIDNFPILPPLKNMGSTTKLSVVMAISPDILPRVVASFFCKRNSLPKYLKNNSSINLFVSSPPLPCDNWIKSIIAHPFYTYSNYYMCLH